MESKTPKEHSSSLSLRTYRTCGENDLNQRLDRLINLIESSYPTYQIDRYFFSRIDAKQDKVSLLLRAIKEKDPDKMDFVIQGLETWIDKRTQTFMQMAEQQMRKKQEQEEERQKLQHLIPSSEELERYNIANLKGLLRQVGLPLQGRKADLLKRLKDFRDLP